MAFVHPSRAGYVPPEDRANDRGQDYRRTDRRPSPSYDYQRPPEPRPSSYQPSNGHMSFLDRRREQRQQSHFSIWAPSPPPSDESDSEAEARDRKKRKHKKDKKHSSKKSSKKRRHRYSDDSEDSEDERERRHSRRKSHKSSRRRSTSRERSREDTSRRDRDRRESPSGGEEDLWIEKGAESRPSTSSRDLVPSTSAAAAQAGSSAQPQPARDQDESSDDEVGPKPAKQIDMKRDPRSYGGALRPGEGSAIANFVASGERIPRRGEIGLESHEIEKFEAAGYVMSGSRHRRMNAIRMRKENQVISAEEQRNLLKLQMEEKAKREQDIVTSFKELVQEKLTDTKRGSK